MSHDTEFNAWLDTAARGLPEAAARAARAELAAHYEDALDDHAARGVEGVEGRRLALAAMGPAVDVARGLLDTHVGRPQVRAAAWLCLWNLLMQPVAQYIIMVEPVSRVERMLAFAAIFALFFPTMVVLESVRMLLEWRLRVPFARLMTGLTMAGSAVTTVAMMLVIFFDPEGETSEVIGQFFPSGLALTGVGLFWLAATSARFGGELAGLGRPLALVTGLLGIGLFALALGAFPGLGEFGRAGYLVVSVAHVALWPTLMVLFYRLGYRRDVEPMLAA